MPIIADPLSPKAPKNLKSYDSTLNTPNPLLGIQPPIRTTRILGNKTAKRQRLVCQPIHQPHSPLAIHHSLFTTLFTTPFTVHMPSYRSQSYQYQMPNVIPPLPLSKCNIQVSSSIHNTTQQKPQPKRQPRQPPSHRASMPAY